jgi:hypothetical protein
MAVIGTSSVHAGALAELVEWWEDLAAGRGGARIVFVPVPMGWGRTWLLGALAEAVRDWPEPTRVVAIAGRDADGRDPGEQVEWLTRIAEQADALDGPGRALLGVDRPPRAAGLGLNLLGLFAPTMPAQVGLLLASCGLGAATEAFDRSAAGPVSRAGRLGEVIARVSAGLPVAVVIDDADVLDARIAVGLVRPLVERLDSQVLVIAAVDREGSELTGRLSDPAGPVTLQGRAHQLEVHAGMDELDRLRLVEELAPAWPLAARVRLAARSQTFEEVDAVLSDPGAGAVATAGSDTVAAEVVDNLASVWGRTAASWPARIVAWAGGLVHRAQLDRALETLGQPVDLDEHVATVGSWVRLADPGHAALIEGAAASLDYQPGLDLARTFIDVAHHVIADPDEGRLGRTAALRPIRYLYTRERARVQAGEIALLVALAEDLAALGDTDEATAVADDGLQAAREIGDDKAASTLQALRLQLLASHPETRDQARAVADQVRAGLGDPLTTDLEALVWATIVRLDDSQTEAEATSDAEALLVRLGRELGPEATWWRLLLGYHLGRTGHPDLAGRALEPLLDSDARPEDRQAADWAVRAIDSHHADDLLYVMALQYQYDALDAGAPDDERLRLHLALAHTNGRLQRYAAARDHTAQELDLRYRLQGPDHPDTLMARHLLAHWTADAGEPAEACRLLAELLSDQVRIQGPDQPDTLSIRHSLARWTGEAGEPAEARRLLAELLPDLTRIIVPDDPFTLTVRHTLGRATREAGELAEARQLFAELLPDLSRVLGPDHPDTLRTRGDLAVAVGEAGEPAEARDLFVELLPESSRVLGPDHIDTLAIRNNIASWTGQAGEPAEGRRLLAELLPDLTRILGPDHPFTLVTRHNLAAVTGVAGEPAEARRLYTELLPDQIRVLGSGHPDTLNSRSELAGQTGKAGDPAEAGRLYAELLPDQVQVLGLDHPDTLVTRRNRAVWTGVAGEPAEACRLLAELVPDQIRVLGPDHPATLKTRSELAVWTGVAGEPAEARRLVAELVPDLTRVLGPDHPTTVATRSLS